MAIEARVRQQRLFRREVSVRVYTGTDSGTLGVGRFILPED